jgi:hypothetical protein
MIRTSLAFYYDGFINVIIFRDVVPKNKGLDWHEDSIFGRNGSDDDGSVLPEEISACWEDKELKTDGHS